VRGRLLAIVVVVVTVVAPLLFRTACLQMPITLTRIGTCVEPLWVVALAIPLVWILLRPHIIADYVVALGAALLLLSLWRWVSEPLPQTVDDLPQLRLKSADLASGVIVARPREYVSLIVDPGDPAQRREYTNVQVQAVFSADGRSVAYTGEMIESVLLAVEPASYDDIIASMKEKKAAIYLWPQRSQHTPTATPAASPTPTPTPLLTATPMPGMASFTLPAAKIQSDLDGLKRGAGVLAILVVERKDTGGNVVGHESGRYQATLLDVLEARGGSLEPPYRRVVEVRLGLMRKSDDGTSNDPVVEQFARQLAGASAIHLLPAQ